MAYTSKYYVIANGEVTYLRLVQKKTRGTTRAGTGTDYVTNYMGKLRRVHNHPDSGALMLKVNGAVVYISKAATSAGLIDAS